MSEKPTTNSAYGELRYPEYLRLDKLLDAQKPLTDSHDELLFIIAHQIFELGFKLLLSEFDQLAECFKSAQPRLALKSTERSAVMMGIMVHQVDMLETMSTLDFLDFRGELEGASGFQSAQFRRSGA